MKTYETSDLWLGVALKSQGYKVRKVEREGRRCIFIFEGIDSHDPTILRYFNRDLKANVRDIATAYEELKSIVSCVPAQWR